MDVIERTWELVDFRVRQAYSRAYMMWQTMDLVIVHDLTKGTLKVYRRSWFVVRQRPALAKMISWPAREKFKTKFGFWFIAIFPGGEIGCIPVPAKFRGQAQ